MLMIPTVGRSVHFFSPNVANKDVASRGPSAAGYGYNGQGAGPYHAVVTQVIKDDDGNVIYVNLAVTPPFGDTFHAGSVPGKGTAYHAPGGSYWEWPPRI